MRKKGQFYIITALLVIGFLFTVIAAPVITTNAVSNFEKLQRNYMSEVPVVVNRAALNDENTTEVLDEFTRAFIAYSVTVVPNFDVVYVFRDDDVVTVGNYFDEQIQATIGSTSYTVLPDSTVAASSATTVLTITELSYTFSLQNTKDFGAVFRKKDGDDIAIIVEE